MKKTEHDEVKLDRICYVLYKYFYTGSMVSNYDHFKKLAMYSDCYLLCAKEIVDEINLYSWSKLEFDSYDLLKKYQEKIKKIRR